MSELSLLILYSSAISLLWLMSCFSRWSFSTLFYSICFSYFSSMEMLSISSSFALRSPSSFLSNMLILRSWWRSNTFCQWVTVWVESLLTICSCSYSSMFSVSTFSCCMSFNLFFKLPWRFSSSLYTLRTNKSFSFCKSESRSRSFVAMYSSSDLTSWDLMVTLDMNLEVGRVFLVFF